MCARKRLFVLGVVVVLLAVGGYAYADTHGSGTSYRTAVATRGTVQRTLPVTGTIASSGRRDLRFGTSGTVEKVLVKQGQHVTKGRVLARLDSTDLHASVLSAKATLAKAKAQLVTDQTSSSSSGLSGSSGTPGSTSTPSTSTGAPAGTGGKGGAPSGPTGGNGGAASGGSGGSGGTGGTPPGGSGVGPTGGSGGGPTGAPPSLDTTAITTVQSTLTADTETLTTALDNYVDFVENTCTSSDTTQSGGACDPSGTAACPTPASLSSLAEAKQCVTDAQAQVSGDASALSTTATTTVGTYLDATKNYAKQLQAAARAQGQAQGEAQGNEASRVSCRLLVGGVTGWWAGVLSIVGVFVLLGGEVVEEAV